MVRAMKKTLTHFSQEMNNKKKQLEQKKNNSTVTLVVMCVCCHVFKTKYSPSLYLQQQQKQPEHCVH